MALFRRKTVEPTEEPVETVEALPQPPAGDDQGRRSVQTYRDYLLSLVPPLEPFGMGITDALGLAVCENVPSPIDVPRRTVASFDGYALMASSTKSAGRPDKLRLQLDRRPPIPIIGGTVVSIQGGQELPRGADAVVSENHM
ncbi:MAG: molybdopterin biosynthesis protein, partial [Cutibacterium granulosum]|nr:molybdopterin biosynthesis protein [Cutibacterium granulosum]